MTGFRNGREMNHSQTPGGLSTSSRRFHMNRVLQLVTCTLGWSLLATALVLPGCKKNTPPTAEPEGPKGNPMLAPLGQPIQGGGAVQDVRRAVRRTADINQLANFSLAYFQAKLLNNTPPIKLEDVKDSLDGNT